MLTEAHKPECQPCSCEPGVNVNVKYLTNQALDIKNLINNLDEEILYYQIIIFYYESLKGFEFILNQENFGLEGSYLASQAFKDYIKGLIFARKSLLNDPRLAKAPLEAIRDYLKVELKLLMDLAAPESQILKGNKCNKALQNRNKASFAYWDKQIEIFTNLLNSLDKGECPFDAFKEFFVNYQIAQENIQIGAKNSCPGCLKDCTNKVC